MSGIYIHIPFCRSKCGYCAFYSLVGREGIQRDYVNALGRELSARVAELSGPVETVYIGGGTPSLLRPDCFAELAAMVKERTGSLGIIREFTIEVNPDDIGIAIADAWKSAGVNRVSMGVQSFSDDELKSIGRRHDAAAARMAYSVLRERFVNVSIDLMFGLPGQTLESWKRTVDEALSLRPEHLSAYSLMFEERSRFTEMLEDGAIEEAAEGLSSEMFRYLAEATSGAGYEHYEISNFALPGFRSVHNSSYWKGVPYLGLGPGASSYDGRRIRRTNPADLRLYLERFGGSCTSDSLCGYYLEEHLTDDELIEEYIMTRLRTIDGIGLEEYASRFGSKEAERLLDKSIRLSALNSGVLSVGTGNITLTENGFFVSDDIIVGLMP